MTILEGIRALWTMSRGVSTGFQAPDGEMQPFDLFRAWYRDAEKAGILMPEAMTLATASVDGVPSARMVLLKELDTTGFVFFTNYESRKAGELDSNPRAALVFHWTFLQRQIRVEGRVERADQATSKAYFDSRPRGSRIGAWASRQSRPLTDRAELEAAVADAEKRFLDGEIPLPEFWGGYRIVPTRIEFWQGRLYRLHDRLVFERQGNAWSRHRLYP